MIKERNHPSDSLIQQKAEIEIIQKVSALLSVKLEKKKIDIGTKQKIEIDGVAESEKILCEAYAHIGELKPSQKHKVIADILKMLLVEKILGGEWKKIVAFGDKQASRSFQGDTLHGKIVKTFGIDIQVINYELETKTAVLKVQPRQKMINAEKM